MSEVHHIGPRARRQLIAVSDSTWRTSAACLNHPTLEPRAWFPTTSAANDRTSVEAMRVCNEECTVKADCLAHSVNIREVDGIWGGMAPLERSRYRRKLQRRAHADQVWQTFAEGQ